MTSGMNTMIFPARDLARAKKMFAGLLGVEPYADEPYYVGFRIGDQEVGLDPHGHAHGATAYWTVPDLKGSLQGLLDAGAKEVEPVRDVGGGKLIAAVQDPDGNIIGLTQNP